MTKCREKCYLYKEKECALYQIQQIPLFIFVGTHKKHFPPVRGHKKVLFSGIYYYNVFYFCEMRKRAVNRSRSKSRSKAPHGDRLRRRSSGQKEHQLTVLLPRKKQRTKTLNSHKQGNDKNAQNPTNKDDEPNQKNSNKQNQRTKH